MERDTLSNMNHLLQSHREPILKACRKYEVARLAAFGSVVRDDFDPDRSDVDFAVRVSH
jgi:predicted nucleotidyltransferase